MKTKIFTFLLVSILISNTYAQSGETSNWIFGSNAGVSWDCVTVSPSAVGGSPLFTNEGVATISDQNCNLLFFSDGATVWDANMNQMPNGYGLTGDNSSTMSAVIVPKPYDPNTYYIFTVDDNLGSGGLAFSRIDMTANGGLGDIDPLEKNIPILPTSPEKIAVTKHANGIDYWVVVHEWNNNTFRSYLITSANIDISLYVQSNVGTVHSGSSADSRGYMKLSPSGSRLIVAIEGMATYELFNFDNNTGILSNPITINGYSDAYGCEFSPDEHYLYAVNRWDNEVHQWDLYQLPNLSNFLNSHLTVGWLGSQTYGDGGAVQLATDSKVYCARDDQYWLSSISPPLSTGGLSVFTQNAINIDVSSTPGLEICGEGLPTFVSNYFYFSDFDVVINTSDLNCYNDSSGEINLTVFGGTTPYVYLWNTGNTTQDLSNLAAGFYYVTIGDFNGNTISDTIEITEPLELILSSIVSNASVFGANDGDIDLTIDGGTSPYYFQWSNGMNTEDISSLNAGNYSVVVYDNNGCTINTSFEINQPIDPNAPNWPYTVTSTNHTILIPDTVTIIINGNPIDAGDYIGVFYDSLGTLACGGYQIWQNNTTSIAAWGTEVGMNNGFTDGEMFKWKIWDISDSIEYYVNANYMPVPPMTDQQFFAVNGMSGLSSLSVSTMSTSQQIVLPLNWCYFSTYISPLEVPFDSILSDIVSNVEIVKNYMGQVYWPAYQVNSIGDYSITQAYQVKMASSDILTINGSEIVPELTDCPIPLGWYLIPYLRTDAAPIVEMLSTITSDIEIVKNSLGQVYWPTYGINVFGDMVPGEGYQIKMNNAANLTYPPNSANVSKSIIQIPQPKHFKTTINTGSNMTLGIPKTAWETKPVMISEIGVFSVSGLLVGSGVYTGKNLAISIWGDDKLTEEIDGLTGKFTLKIWNGESLNLSGEQILEIETWLEGDDFYETNKISVVEKISNIEHRLTNIEIFQNTPNPFSETTEIGIFLPEKTFVEIELFNLIGEKIETIQSQNYPHGKHTIIYDRKHLPAGTYFYRLSSGDFSETRIMSVE